MGRSRKNNNEDEENEEEEEEEEEEKQQQEQEMPPPPPRAARRSRASSAASAAKQQDEEEEEEEEDWGDEDEEMGSKGSKGGGKKWRSSGKEKKPAAKKGRPSASTSKSEHLTQASYFCDTEVEVGFTFTQVSGGGGGGSAGGGKKKRGGGGGDGEGGSVVCPGASQVSQDVLLLDHEERKFEALPQTQRDAAVGAAVRLILFKGCRREPVLKKAVNDEVAKNYGKALVKPILKAAAAKLEKTFGYTLVAPPTHKFPKEADTYYLINKVAGRNAALQQQLNAYGRDVGYRGFVMVVLGLVFCSASAKIQEHELLTQISTLESHLTVQYKANSDEEFVVSGALEGVGDVGLALERMRKEHYLVREREEALRRQEGGSAHEWWFKLGPRAYVEVGPRQLLKFLAESQGQEVDATMLREIEAEERRCLEE